MHCTPRDAASRDVPAPRSQARHAVPRAADATRTRRSWLPRECGPSVAHSRGRGSERNGDDVERSRRPRLPPVAIHPCDHTDQTSSGAYHHVLPCGHVATQMRGIPKRLGSKAASRIPRRESIACNTMGWRNLPGRSHSRFCPPGLAHDHARWTDPYRFTRSPSSDLRRLRPRALPPRSAPLLHCLG